MTSRRIRGRVLAALALTSTLVAAACGGAGSGSPSGPIILGGVFTLTPVPFGGDAKKTAQQVFEHVNATGGIDGRKIKYITGDDQASPTKSGAAARKSVSEGAVAMVASASFVDCGTNRAFYHREHILSIQAVGVDPYCFHSPNIASVTVSPFSQLTANMYYASEVLGDSRLCLFQPTTPGTQKAIEKAITRWKKLTGNKLVIDDHNIPTNQTKFTDELLRAKAKNCDAIIYGGGDTVASPMLKAAANQGMTDVDFMFVSVAYTRQLADAAGGLGMNVYATTGMYPFTEHTEKTKQWRSVAKKAGAQQTAFSEAGYIAAKWMVHVLSNIDGDITRESVTAQLRKGKKYHSPLVPAPLVFGDAKSHNRTSGINVMRIKNGQWERVDTLELPSVK